ncbi:MAG TPA: TIGR00730 family Rossman fold protein [Ktedonobacterales bacterium]|jgi:hypothetical protein|nr:TIGR00730 family Rossman fold protein [Ktedonobacterales bacterium]
MPVIRRICVFAGSRPGARPAYAAAAAALGAALATRGIGLVYGGASVGLMGILADAALARGGEVIGVIPHALAAREITHRVLSELHMVKTMHERKALMAELSDAFIGLPGGWGTFDEVFEMLTWSQLGVHTKPVGLLSVADYFRPLLALVEHAEAEGFIAAGEREFLVVGDEADALLDSMTAYQPSAHPRIWITPREI